MKVYGGHKAMVYCLASDSEGARVGRNIYYDRNFQRIWPKQKPWIDTVEV